jgi:hypothetical protein
MRGPGAVFLLACYAAASGVSAAAEACVIFNPKKSECADELVRLTLAPPGPAGSFVVTEDGKEVAYQVEEAGGKPCLWVCATFPAGASRAYAIAPGKPAQVAPRVKVSRDGPDFLLDNGLAAVKVPAEPGGGIPLPARSLRLPSGRWIGGGAWRSRMPLRKFSATVGGDGTLFGKIRLRYEFEGKGGILGESEAFAEVEVALGPGWRHIEIAERHAMGREDGWEFDLSAGWAPREGRACNFDGGLGRPLPEPNRPLVPVDHQAYPPDTYLKLLPRWNQNYRDGWAFRATDGNEEAGAVVVSASRWDWPHDNAITAVVKPSGDYAGLRCPTYAGRRLWWLIASPEPAQVKYAARYAWEHMDKLNHEMILSWPGQSGSYSGLNFYDNLNINPTSMIRGWNRKAIENAGKPGDYRTLATQQTLLHPDSYGSYWQYWTPNNPNFFSDFYTRAIVLVTNLKEHPRYEELKRRAVLLAREDIYHSVTLPGGAGQECPGYMSIGHWTRFGEILNQHLGVDDPVIQERLAAAVSFRRRISQPDGQIRRRLPIGDTHNGPDGPRVEDVPADEVARWTTTELPGFGVIFNAKPGTEKESYLSFKSGPNRGHYHGDQLAFHYCANAGPVAVDHHCSYHPRASQEHLHNRVAFSTDTLPSANMDGFERLIAFKTSPEADVAVGQVESDRLRHLDPFPPPKWHPEWPQQALGGPLVYRRTVVLLKGAEQDYFVIRDQFTAPAPLHATYCLHALDPEVIPGTPGGARTEGRMLLDEAQDFTRLGVQPGWMLAVLDSHTVRGSDKLVDGSVYFSSPVVEVAPTALTVKDKLPGGDAVRPDAHVAQPGKALPGKPIRHRLFKPVARPADGLFRFNNGLRLYCAASGPLEVSHFPWEHPNGGRESTQGLRLTLRGAREGQFITVLSHGRDVEFARLENGARIGQDEVLFAGPAAAPTAGEGPQVIVRRKGRELLVLTGREIDLDRSQGEIGLCVHDSGHPFGGTPDWLLRQRRKPPAWHEPAPGRGGGR